MKSLPILTLSCLSLISTTNALSRAQPAVQRLRSRSLYQGGWPLALTGSASPSCPAEASVSCSDTHNNPACCPTGQTCIFSNSVDGNYCCPTDADCNTAVLNFPVCANATWVMFEQYPAGYFCCEPGKIGVTPSSAGLPGGLCEDSDQVVPTSLLATIAAQVVAPTAKPSASAVGNGTTTGGPPLETNPGEPNTSTSTSTSGDSTGYFNTGAKIGVGIVAAVFVLMLVCGTRCVRRRKTGYSVPTAYEYGTEYSPYHTGYQQGYRPGYAVEPHGDGRGNNVTVNVVHGDMQT